MVCSYRFHSFGPHRQTVWYCYYVDVGGTLECVMCGSDVCYVTYVGNPRTCRRGWVRSLGLVQLFYRLIDARYNSTTRFLFWSWYWPGASATCVVHPFHDFAPVFCSLWTVVVCLMGLGALPEPDRSSDRHCQSKQTNCTVDLSLSQNGT